MSAAPSITPVKPLGAKSLKLSLVKAVTPTTMKKASTASLMTTITVLLRVLSRTPKISSAVTARTSAAAGTFTVPPSPGGRAIESERVMPNRLSSSSLK